MGDGYPKLFRSMQVGEYFFHFRNFIVFVYERCKSGGTLKLAATWIHIVRPAYIYPGIQMQSSVVGLGISLG